MPSIGKIFGTEFVDLKVTTQGQEVVHDEGELFKTNLPIPAGKFKKQWTVNYKLRQEDVIFFKCGFSGSASEFLKKSKIKPKKYSYFSTFYEL